MVISLLLIAIVLVVLLTDHSKDVSSRRGRVAFLFLFLFAVCSFVALGIGGSLFPDGYVFKESPESQCEIVALLDEPGALGTRFLLLGEVDGKPYYYYATESSDGIEMKHVSAENVYIVRRDDETPHMEKWVAHPYFKDLSTLIYAFPDTDSCYVVVVPDGDFPSELSFLPSWAAIKKSRPD